MNASTKAELVAECRRLRAIVVAMSSITGSKGVLAELIDCNDNVCLVVCAPTEDERPFTQTIAREVARALRDDLALAPAQLRQLADAYELASRAPGRLTGSVTEGEGT